MNQFATYLDADGNLWMNAGTVQCFHGTTTDVFHVGRGGRVMMGARGGMNAFRPVAKGGTSLQGGSGRNANVSGGPAGTLVPQGFFQAVGPNQWSGPRGAMLAFDPGDGSAQLHDGTDVLATLAAGGATVAPYGTFASTPYGDGLNGSVPFTVAVSYEGSPVAWPARDVHFTPHAGTAPPGKYLRSGWQSWQHETDMTWTMTLDENGAGTLADGTGVVATRRADPERIYDASGTWIATPYGKIVFHGDEEWSADVTESLAFPIAGHLYLELVLDETTREVLSVNGPFFQAVLPSNGPASAIARIAESDGLGGVDQIQEGPVYWKP